MHLDIRGTSGAPVTPEIHEAHLLYVLELEIVHGPRVGVKLIIDVPGDWIAFLVRVQEDGDVREAVVVIDDVCEIRHSFFPLIRGGVESIGRGVINRVYRRVPSLEMLDIC